MSLNIAKCPLVRVLGEAQLSPVENWPGVRIQSEKEAQSWDLLYLIAKYRKQKKNAGELGRCQKSIVYQLF